MQSHFRPLLAVAAVFAAFILPLFSPASASAGSLDLAGDTTGAPTFNRPTETGALSLFDVPYQAYRFTVSLDGAYDFSLSAVDPGLYDTFLHLYVGGFNPAAPAQGFFRANDDNSLAAGGTTNSALAGISLSAASTYYLVADGFSGSDFGAYTASIRGPGDIAASVVPEPSASVLLTSALGGLLGLMALRRRQRRQGRMAVA